MTLDLDEGDPERAEASADERARIAREKVKETQEAGKARSRGKRATGGSSSSGSRPTVAQRTESELTSRLHRTFDRIALTLDARGDDELAQVIREETDAMSQGFVSLVRNVKPLAGPLVLVLNLVEPVLAFGRVARVLFTRFMDRRARLAEERLAAQAEWDAQQMGQAVAGA